MRSMTWGFLGATLGGTLLDCAWSNSGRGAVDFDRPLNNTLSLGATMD